MPNPNTAKREDLDVPNQDMRIEVTRDVLPVHCPLNGSSLWNSHPRVYIPVEETGRARCPYCGAEYILID
ncbi:MAG TPA: zinc-finger domain-containing protein [Gammaproteobacteria bacterium]|nr:zinc-finger domain-containing protein [Gammaproteobacteria bacterium]